MAHEEERHTDISQADLLREGDFVSSSSSNNNRITQQAAACIYIAAAVAHHARPKPPSAQESRQGSKVGHDEERCNGVPDGVT